MKAIYWREGACPTPSEPGELMYMFRKAEGDAPPISKVYVALIKSDTDKLAWFAVGDELQL